MTFDFNMVDMLSAVKNQKKRSFETYVLGPFLMWYAYKDRGMTRRARRMLAAAGAYVVMRNLDSYQEALASLPKRKVLNDS